MNSRIVFLVALLGATAATWSSCPIVRTQIYSPAARWWYLMTAPMPSPKSYNYSAPISQWTRGPSFETADACRSAQLQIKSFVRTQTGPDSVWLYSRCVAYDDPRLKADPEEPGP
jgi:hypothetical protein